MKVCSSSDCTLWAKRLLHVSRSLRVRFPSRIVAPRLSLCATHSWGRRCVAGWGPRIGGCRSCPRGSFRRRLLRWRFCRTASGTSRREIFSPLRCGTARAPAAHEQGTEACSQRPLAVNRGRRCVHAGALGSARRSREHTSVPCSPVRLPGLNT